MKTKKAKNQPKHGDLKVWWIPQIPGKPFEVPVASLVEAKLLLDTLAYYDQFQLDNNIKPDYCNAGGLKFFDENDKQQGQGDSWGEWDGSWCDWEDDDGNGIDEFDLDDLRLRSHSSQLPVCYCQ